ncbi:MAG: diacylglycerol/lipid kinase family protein [Bacillota bacterium]
MTELEKNLRLSKDLADKIFTVVNPVSANGRTGKKWPDIAEYLKNNNIDFVFRKSEYSEHAVAMVREALRSGYKYIMSVGGDGTANEVVNGFFEKGHLINPEANLIIFSRGTGSDFIKSLGINNSKKEIIDIIKKGRKKLIDIGKVEYINNQNYKAERYFINISDAGIGGETVAYVEQGSKFFSGKLTYLFGALKSLVFYKNKKFKVKIDNKEIFTHKATSILVANGSHFAGGMKIAPEAEVDDGLFNLIVLGDLNKFEIITNLYKAYSGNHLSHPKVECYQGKDIEITSKEKVFLNIDGEAVGKIPAHFKIIPKKIGVLIL